MLGGDEVDFDELFKSLDWISIYTSCFGHEESGGSLDCSIRRYTREKVHGIYSECQEVEGCDRFQWLGEYGETLRKKVSDSRGKTRKELISETLEAIE